jgi:hypothetical protein
MKRALIGTGSLCALVAAPALGQLYSEDFSADATANWTVNAGPTDVAANFFFDYSSVGIPAAPNTTDGSTRGMKLQANESSGVFGGMSVSPTGLNLTGDYTVRFDVWSNFNGSFPVGGSGSTQMSTYGVMTSGSVAQWPGGTQDSTWFGTTTDGNSSVDWRAYSPDAPTGYVDQDPVFAATGIGNRNQSHPYYAGFGGVSAPAAQVALFPQQTGTTLIGSAGMEWHEVEIAKAGSVVTWTMDGLLLATVDTAGMTLGGGNIFFGHSDTNGSSSSDPNDSLLLFTLVDNIVVVPAPGAAGLLGIAGLMLVRRRR